MCQPKKRSMEFVFTSAFCEVIINKTENITVKVKILLLFSHIMYKPYNKTQWNYSQNSAALKK